MGNFKKPVRVQGLVVFGSQIWKKSENFLSVVCRSLQFILLMRFCCSSVDRGQESSERGFGVPVTDAVQTLLESVACQQHRALIHTRDFFPFCASLSGNNVVARRDYSGCERPSGLRKHISPVVFSFCGVGGCLLSAVCLFLPINDGEQEFPFRAGKHFLLITFKNPPLFIC